MKYFVKICIVGSCFFMLSIIGYSQQPYNIEWNSHPDQSAKIPRLSFKGVIYENPNFAIPILSLDFNGISIEKFEVTDAKYKKLTKEEVALLPSFFEQLNLSIEIRKGVVNKNPISIVNIIPIRINPKSDSLEKLLSFKYKITKAIPKPTNISKIRFRTSAVENSVLATGDWHKLKIKSTSSSTGSGIYKIDYDLLKTMIGSAIENIDPRKLKIFGNGGIMLPEANSAQKINDLQENAIYVEGEADGKFDRYDYVLFYGIGSDIWRFDTIKKIYSHTKNIYSDNSYYFLTISENLGKRVVERTDTGEVLQDIQEYPEHLFYEKDVYNLLKSGRTWYSDEFDGNIKKDITFNLEGIIPGTAATITSSLMAQSLISSSFDLSFNGVKANTYTISASKADYGVKGNQVTRDFKYLTSDNFDGKLLVNYTYKKVTNSSIGFLNYCEVNYFKKLVFNGKKLNFRSTKSDGVSAFNIGNVNQDIKIWDITNKFEPAILPYSVIGLNANFKCNTDIAREFYAFVGNDFEKPEYVGKMANQNLHALAQKDLPDLVIVTTEDLLPAARELADFRIKHDKLNTVVATTDQIYNEFSSGSQDLVAIRNFIKMLYDKNTSSDSLSYLLFFGSASYDYKDRIKNNTHKVPVYQTPESLDDIVSQSSDDYCGFLDDDEGDWDNPRVVHYLNIGIGRLIVRNLEEANGVVKKLIHYSSSPLSMGNWRNKVCLVADNADKSPNFIHLNNAEVMANAITKKSSNININKLYLDAFPLVSAPGGQTSPAIKDALLKEINKGTLIVNYSGHGSEFTWAQENIINTAEITALKNLNNLPFFVTATCQFGRYDDPDKFSGAQGLTLNPIGGAIGILTSTRPVYAFSNESINKAFYDQVFKFDNNKKPRLGDVMMETKNNSIVGYNNRNYSLLGDPSMMLAYPEQDIYITSLNGKADTASLDTLNALSKIILSGVIRNNGTVNQNFNGTIRLSIYDKPSIVNTELSTFKVQNNMIFDGAASVSNGKFTHTFIVPKDISYNFGQGKFSLYSYDSLNGDAGGIYTNIIIGGSSGRAISDTTPPTIKLFIGDNSFLPGGLANSDTKILAYLEDSSGINISNTGIGHEIIGILNDNKEVIVMNDYYTSEPNSYRKGVLSYPLYNLTPGKYTVQVKAWDTYNNSKIESIDFVVPENNQLVIDDVFNSPNPFSDETTISFEHNRSGEELNVEMAIFTITGEQVKWMSINVKESPARVTAMTWDGRDSGGSKVNRGMYLARIKVAYPTLNKEIIKNIKLILLN